MSLPRISVVVTCYNCRDYIADTIRSVARQTLRDFDCVIVNDASTDDSAAVVQRTLEELGHDPRFRQVRLAKNVGQTAATRAGLAESPAPFVCFPDDDEAFRLHMDFYVVVMAQMVSGSLLIDEPLYAYRLHGKNFAANNPVLGGRLHLSARNWGNPYATMLDRMLAAMVRDRERFVAALGERQYRRMLFRMKAARASPWFGWLFVLCSWLI